MNLKELLSQKQSRLIELKSLILSGDDAAIKESEILVKELEELEDKIKKSEIAMEKLSQIGNSNEGKEDGAETFSSARSLGEHFAKYLSTYGFKKGDTHQHFSVVAPEYKANTDTQLTPESVQNALTTIDRNVVERPRTALVIRDLFAQETISGNMLEYYVEGEMEGQPAVTPEGTAKPQIHFADPEKHTVSLDKIAEFIKESDEYIADATFLSSAINSRLLYQLFLAEQNYLVNKLITASGIQTDTTNWKASSTASDVADLIFGCMTDVELGSGFAADGIVMNPATWQLIRLGKNASGNYYGGGYFEDGQTKRLWGIPVITTTAVTASQIIVGAFRACGSVVSKGGYSVEATNTDQDDFIKNKMTIRAEERLALALRRPAGFKLMTKAA